MTTYDLVVVGAGVSGLAAADAAARRGARVLLLEQSDSVGGVIRNATFMGQSIELAADAIFIRDKECASYLEELTPKDQYKAPATTQAWILDHELEQFPQGCVLGVPTSFFKAFSLSKGLDERLRLIKNTIFPKRTVSQDPTVAEIVETRLNSSILQNITEPLLGGIYAGDTRSMSAKHVHPMLHAANKRRDFFKALKNARKSYAPKVVGFEGGIRVLVNRLSERAKQNGAEIHVNAKVNAISKPSTGEGWIVSSRGRDIEAKAVLVTTHPHISAQLIKSYSRLSYLLQSWPSTSVTMVLLAYPIDDLKLPDNASGLICTRQLSRLVTAVSFNSKKWSHRRHPTHEILRVSTGHVGDQRHESMADEHLVAAVHQELAKPLAIAGEPADAIVARWVDAFPLYNSGHDDRLQEVQSWTASLQNIAFAGNAFAGIGIWACISNSIKQTNALLSQLTLERSQEQRVVDNV